MIAAAVDIGTNSVRLLIADDDGGERRELHREVIVTRLGQGVDSSGRLDEAAIERTVGVLNRYGRIVEERQVAAKRAVATSATRDASNGFEFLERATAALGFVPEVIGGDEEAHLSFRGARPAEVAAPVLVIDTGGGSTEFVVGLDRVSYARSVDIGSVRLTERSLGSGPHAPERIDATRAEVAAMFRSQLDLPRASAAIGVAGTFTSLAAIHLDLPQYDRDAVHGTVLSLADIAGLVDSLAGMRLEHIEAIPSLDPRRAPVIVGGAIVVEQAVAHSKLDEVTVSERDILDGIIDSLVDELSD